MVRDSSRMSCQQTLVEQEILKLKESYHCRLRRSLLHQPNPWHGPYYDKYLGQNEGLDQYNHYAFDHPKDGFLDGDFFGQDAMPESKSSSWFKFNLGVEPEDAELHL